MSNTLLHKKVNSFGDSPNTNLTRPFEWNQEHIFTGGVNGQLLEFDNTKSDNVKWANRSTLPILDISKPPFNAPNTGTIDATSQIMLAIETAKENGGGVILIPPGQYLINAGNQIGSTSLGIVDAENIFIIGYGGVLLAGENTGRVIGIYNSHNVKILNLKIIGNTFRVGDSFSQQLHGICIGRNSSYVEIVGCYITNFLGDCIALGGDFDDGALLGFTSKYISIHHNTLKTRVGNGVTSVSLGSGSRLAISITDNQHVSVHDNTIFGGVDCEVNANNQYNRQISINNNQFKNGPVISQVAIGNDFNFDEVVIDREDGGSKIQCVLSCQGVSATPIVDGVVFSNNQFEEAKVVAFGPYRADIINNHFNAGLIELGATTGGNSNSNMEVSGNISKSLIVGETGFIKFTGSITACRFVNNIVYANSGYCIVDAGAATGDGGANYFNGNCNLDPNAIAVFNLLQTVAVSVLQNEAGPILTSVCINNWSRASAAVERASNGLITVRELGHEIVNIVLNTDGVLVSGTTYDLDYLAHPGNKYFITSTIGSLLLRDIVNVREGTEITIMNGVVGGATLTIIHGAATIDLDSDTNFVMNTIQDTLMLLSRADILFETSRIED